MRGWRLLAIAALVGAVSTSVATAEERIFPSTRSGPGAVSPPSPAATNQVPDRAPLRDSGGTFRGFHDAGDGRGRGIARETDGRAAGTVVPNRTGGGIIRDSDGTARGIAPSRARTPTFQTRSYRR